MANTANFTVGPNSGWVQVVTGPVLSFFTCRHIPKHVPVHYRIDTATPALNAQGVRHDDTEFWANGAFAVGTNVYARINSSATDSVRIYVFQN